MIIKFSGDEADNHRIPAYYGAISLRGISRTLIMTGHYVSTGKIRRRYPYDDNIEFYFKAQREGSLQQLVEIVINNPESITTGAIGGALGNSISTGLAGATKLVTNYTKLLLTKAAGLVIDEDDDFLRELDGINPNETDALVEAIEPAVRDMHVPINYGVRTISLQSGSRNLVTLDSSTRDYVFTSELDDEENNAEASIASLSVNTGSGRAFIFEYGRSFPFQVSRNAPPNTIAVLSTSLNRYALQNDSNILIKFSKIKTSDGRIKKVLISEAKFIRPE